MMVPCPFTIFQKSLFTKNSGKTKSRILLFVNTTKSGVRSCPYTTFRQHDEILCSARTQRQLEELVRSCAACAVEPCNPYEPIIASDTFLRPWQNVGTDMFVYKKATYLLVVDYASSYVEITKLAETTSPDVILHLRSIFARHVIPETGRSMHHMTLRGLPGKKASYTSLAALVTLRVMAKRNVLCRPLIHY